MRRVRTDGLAITGEFFSISDEFTAYIDEYDNGLMRHIRLEWVGNALSFDDGLALMKWNETFLDFLTALLTSCEMDGFVWELPAISDGTLNRQFEFVLIDTGQPYHREPDAKAFAAQLAGADKADGFAVFGNLGGDATLIAPVETEGADFRDLLHFMQFADADRRRQFWKTLAATVTEKISADPLWISVSGAGVAWLHVRLDREPKYYLYGPYRDKT